MEIFFFASTNNLLEIIRDIKTKVLVKYIKIQSYSAKDEIKIYGSLLEYEKIGINESGNHQSEQFLVIPKDQTIEIRETRLSDGDSRFFIDQYNNKNSIVFWPGGIYENKYLICGHVATIDTSGPAKKLFNTFSKGIKKSVIKKLGTVS